MELWSSAEFQKPFNVGKTDTSMEWNPFGWSSTGEQQRKKKKLVRGIPLKIHVSAKLQFFTVEVSRLRCLEYAYFLSSLLLPLQLNLDPA